ncbi:hypothetical protein CYMTET_23152 [Cymbomonas tetramitiformis]|uniref:Uncharacterized protein n=1 Tax=Cymbomonas tetramitiformis TaxID=36881 RepID=A0AAE0L184_9CHLO|nr:hypothetical protein CYMTET_23152 [Cymbomonas tetramitiformis]
MATKRTATWTSIVKSLQTAFEQKEAANTALFDLADATKEVNVIFNGILFSTLTSSTSPNSTARRWVEASGRASPRNGKRALLEVTKRLIPRVVRPLGHYEELCSIFVDPKLDPDPLIQDFDGCLTAIRNGASGALDDMVAKKQLLASLDTTFYDKANPDNGRIKQDTASVSTIGVAYSGLPYGMDVQKLIKDFQVHIDAANEVLSSLKDNVDDDKPPTR